jgi:hypothetical protein
MRYRAHAPGSLPNKRYRAVRSKDCWCAKKIGRDCVIGLGRLSYSDNTSHIPLDMTIQGVYCEKI